MFIPFRCEDCIHGDYLVQDSCYECFIGVDSEEMCEQKYVNKYSNKKAKRQKSKAAKKIAEQLFACEFCAYSSECHNGADGVCLASDCDDEFGETTETPL